MLQHDDFAARVSLDILLQHAHDGFGAQVMAFLDHHDIGLQLAHAQMQILQVLVLDQLDRMLAKLFQVEHGLVAKIHHSIGLAALVPPEQRKQLVDQYVVRNRLFRIGQAIAFDQLLLQ